MDSGSEDSLLDQGRLEPVASADGAFAPRIHVEEEGLDEEYEARDGLGTSMTRFKRSARKRAA